MQRRIILQCAGLTLIACLLGTKSASADTPPTATNTMLLAAPATLLGITNPYLIAAAMETPAKTPNVQSFTVARDIRDLARHIEKLARQGVDLHHREEVRTEKLQLRVDTGIRGVGGVLTICYRR